MHRHDGAGPRRDGGVDQSWIDRVGGGVDVDQDRRGADRNDGEDRGDEGVRGGDDFVARTDAEPPERQLNRSAAGTDANAVPGTGEAGELLFKGRNGPAADEVSPTADLADGIIELTLKTLMLSGQVNERHMHRCCPSYNNDLRCALEWRRFADQREWGSV